MNKTCYHFKENVTQIIRERENKDLMFTMLRVIFQLRIPKKIVFKFVCLKANARKNREGCFSQAHEKSRVTSK
mgnify:CR=1 FL=1